MDATTGSNCSVEPRRVEHSQILVADGAVAVRIQPGGGTGLEATPGILDTLTLRPLPALRARARGTLLVGRDGILGSALADLDAGRQIQLVGAGGAGRGAVARALVDLAAARALPGAVLLGGAEQHSLDSLYTRLAGLFFDVRWHRPDEDALRGVTERLAPAGLITVTDFELAADEAERLLQTFPGCRFLVTSTAATLRGSAEIHEVSPLTAADAITLVRGALGRELSEPEHAQALAAHRYAQGHAAALLTSAAFLRRAAADPRATALVTLPPEQQAALLITGLDEPSRRILAALAYFGPAPAALFPLLADIAQAVEPAGVVSALEYPGLIALCDEGYAATPDAARAVAGGAAVPAELPDIAERLCAGYTQALAPTAQPGQARPVAPAPPPPPRFALEVVRAQITARNWDSACRLARAAAVVAVSGGRMGPWSELVALGAQAARESGRRDDLRYFLREQHTDALLRNDAAAAAAALLALSALLRSSAPTPAPTVKAKAKPRTQRNTAGRALRTGRRIATAGHGAGAAAAAIAVAAVAGALVGASQHPHTSAALNGPAGSAASAAAWTAAAPGTPPTWTVSLSGSPISPLPAAAGKVTAQFPVITGGVTDAAARTRLDSALQQPILAGIDRFASSVQAAESAGLGTAGFYITPVTETTAVTQVGDLLSVVYTYQDAPAVGGVATTSTIVVRKDTGTVVPQQAILSAATTTPAGAARLDALVGSLEPATAPGGGQAKAAVLATGCQASNGNEFTGPPIGVTPTGLTFYVSSDQDGCGGAIAVPVPFSKLTGLVNPLIVQLAKAGSGGSIR